jgi:lysophospholipase L1-like esterase
MLACGGGASQAATSNSSRQQLYGFGDSTFVGVGASSPSMSWPSQVAAAKSWTLDNYGISGSWVADQADAYFSVPAAKGDINLAELSVNDMRGIGTDSAEQSAFAEEALSVLAYRAIPDSSKVFGAGAVLSGTWSTPNFYGGAICRDTADAGASATFTVDGTVVYVTGILQIGNASTWTLAVDGASKGTFSTLSPLPWTGTYDRSYGPYGVRIAGLRTGSHTVTFTSAAGTDADNMAYFCWAGGNSGAGPSWPKVYQANTIRLTEAGYEYGGSDVAVSQFNALLKALDTTLVSDGLNISYVNISSGYDPDTMASPDGVHPDDAGYTAIANAALATMR